ncbi:cation:proton antiporter [Actinomadura barringtoniae]|uniref:Cation:proton antiporter n=1 Tax=Actinomadura barringtoniae TaxID=1427535 RepID=A0A939PMC7_9ACTN|nr:cation:proton antiporter [Actinomadura barringtoniae]MBO2455592.1 cation:proton antiporter [Actinomadura barringtoniae]
MLPTIVCSLIVILLWTFASRRLLTWHVSGPVVMVAGGIVAGLVTGDHLWNHLNTDIAERLVELILSVLLFVDAIEVRGGFLAGERGVAVRLLLVALPLSLGAAFVLGLFLLGSASWAVALVVACVVMPVDFAPAAALLRDDRLPRRLRHVLAVESGYNDGIFSPVFALALVMLGVSGHGKDPGEALANAVPAALYAVLIGVGVGVVTGLALRRSVAAGWTDTAAIRIAMVLVPLITYALAVGAGGNGFVAAFIAGIAYKFGRMGDRAVDTDITHAELAAVDDLSVVTTMIMWFVFGALIELVFRYALAWPWLLYAALALTAARMLPVYLSMIGSPASRRDRTLLGLIGPRGVSSIVFGLLAFNKMGDDDAAIVLCVMTFVIFGSLLLQGVAIPIGARRLSPATDKPFTDAP